MQTVLQLASLVLVTAWIGLPLFLLGALAYSLIARRLRRKDRRPQVPKFESTGPAGF